MPNSKPVAADRPRARSCRDSGDVIPMRPNGLPQVTSPAFSDHPRPYGTKRIWEAEPHHSVGSPHPPEHHRAAGRAARRVGRASGRDRGVGGRDGDVVRRSSRQRLPGADLPGRGDPPVRRGRVGRQLVRRPLSPGLRGGVPGGRRRHGDRVAGRRLDGVVGRAPRITTAARRPASRRRRHERVRVPDAGESLRRSHSVRSRADVLTGMRPGGGVTSMGLGGWCRGVGIAVESRRRRLPRHHLVRLARAVGASHWVAWPPQPHRGAGAGGGRRARGDRRRVPGGRDVPLPRRRAGADHRRHRDRVDRDAPAAHRRPLGLRRVSSGGDPALCRAQPPRWQPRSARARRRTDPARPRRCEVAGSSSPSLRPCSCGRADRCRWFRASSTIRPPNRASTTRSSPR